MNHLPPKDSTHEEIHTVKDDKSNHKSHKEREKLPAEQKFDKAVYGGISYAAQAGTGIALSYWIKHGSGRPIFDKIAKWFGPKVLSKITQKKGAEAIAEADSWIVVSTMVMVGNAFLIPVKWLEDRKVDIVKKWTERDNTKLEESGCALSEDAKHKQKELLTELESESKQTWWSLIKGRTFGLGAVYAVLYAIGKDNNAKAAEATSKTITKSLSKFGVKNAENSKPIANALDIGFYDVFYSAVSAGGLYVYSHFINPPTDGHPDHNKTKLIAALVEPDYVRKTKPNSKISDVKQIISNNSHLRSSTDFKPKSSFVDAHLASKSIENNELSV